jgi:hypothetical protein
LLPTTPPGEWTGNNHRPGDFLMAAKKKTAKKATKKKAAKKKR